MKKFLSTIGSFLSAPYRAGVEFVDTRPSFSSVRDHLNTQVFDAIKVGDGFNLVSGVEGQDTKEMAVLHRIDFNPPGSNLSLPSLAQAEDQIQECVETARAVSSSVVGLRRSTIAKQSAIAKEIAKTVREMEKKQEVAACEQAAMNEVLDTGIVPGVSVMG